MPTSLLSRSPVDKSPEVTIISSHTAFISPRQRKAMSLTQTYHLAHLARGKLSSEASRSEHRLHRLVGHANLLDGLMIELQTAEQEQERWFNATVKKATAPSQSRTIRWVDEIVVEEPESDWQAEDADIYESDSSEDEEDEPDADMPILARVPSHSSNNNMSASVLEVAEQEEEEEELRSLALRLTPSHTAAIPELESDDEEEESEDDDETMPKSPELDTTMDLGVRVVSDKQRPMLGTGSYYVAEAGKEQQRHQQSLFEGGLYLRNAVSVY